MDMLGLPQNEQGLFTVATQDVKDIMDRIKNLPTRKHKHSTFHFPTRDGLRTIFERFRESHGELETGSILRKFTREVLGIDDAFFKYLVRDKHKEKPEARMKEPSKVRAPHSSALFRPAWPWVLSRAPVHTYPARPAAPRRPTSLEGGSSISECVTSGNVPADAHQGSNRRSWVELKHCQTLRGERMGRRHGR